MLTEWQRGDWEVTCDSQGGRLAQLSWRGRKLLTPSPPSPLPRGEGRERWGDYETRPVFGYDDCWPSLEVSPWPGRGRTVRDHGELCWVAWTVEAGESLRAVATDPEGDWVFARELSVVAGALRFDFVCANTGAEPLCMSWAGHALVPPDAVRELALPDCERVRWEWPPGCGFEDEPASAQDVWPFLRQREGEAVMLVLEHCASPTVTVALDGVRWTLAIEGVARPSLGLWHNTGAYPPEPGLERHEFGLEWMLTPECVLEQAVRSGSAITLAPHASHRWSVIWSLEEHT
jgi:hypothetical protein